MKKLYFPFLLLIAILGVKNLHSKETQDLSENFQIISVFYNVPGNDQKDFESVNFRYGWTSQAPLSIAIQFTNAGYADRKLKFAIKDVTSNQTILLDPAHNAYFVVETLKANSDGAIWAGLVSNLKDSFSLRVWNSDGDRFDQAPISILSNWKKKPKKTPTPVPKLMFPSPLVSVTTTPSLPAIPTLTTSTPIMFPNTPVIIATINAGVTSPSVSIIPSTPMCPVPITPTQTPITPFVTPVGTSILSINKGTASEIAGIIGGKTANMLVAAHTSTFSKTPTFTRTLTATRTLTPTYTPTATYTPTKSQTSAPVFNCSYASFGDSYVGGEGADSSVSCFSYLASETLKTWYPGILYENDVCTGANPDVWASDMPRHLEKFVKKNVPIGYVLFETGPGCFFNVNNGDDCCKGASLSQGVSYSYVYQKNMDKIISDIYAVNPNVHLVVLSTADSSGGEGHYAPPEVYEAYRQRLFELKDKKYPKMRIADIYTAMKGHSEYFRHDGDDKDHPNDLGQAIIAKCILAQFSYWPYQSSKH